MGEVYLHGTNDLSGLAFPTMQEINIDEYNYYVDGLKKVEGASLANISKSHDLLAPACESLGHSSRKAEEIQTAYSNLREQDATSLDICKEAFDHAVAQADQDEEIEQDIVLPNDRRLVNSQYIQSQVLNVEIHSDCLGRQIFREGVLEVHRESE